MAIEEYYKILEIETNASREEIKQAYRHLAKIWHPDRFYNDPKMKQQADEKIKQINQAYEALKYYAVNSGSLVSGGGVAIEKTNPEYYYQQGVDNAERENYYEAIENFSRALRINPKFIIAYQYRGFIREKLGLKKSAESDFQMVFKLKLAKGEKASSSKSKTPNSVSKQSYPKAQDRTPSKPYSSQPTTSVSSGSPKKTDFPPQDPTSISENSILSWERKFTLKGHLDIVSSLAVYQNNQFFVSGSIAENNLKIRNISNGKTVASIFLDSEILSQAFSPNGQILATASCDRKIRLWNVNTGKLICTLTGHIDKVSSVCFSSDGETIVSGSLDRTIRLWQLNNWKNTCTIQQFSPVFSMVVSANFKTIITGTSERTIEIWQRK